MRANTDIKVIQTHYNGYSFRSRLEARWAVFFDACGVKYEYEPEGYDLGNGLMYLPDFLLHGVDGRCSGNGGNLYVEVKGQMTDIDAEKINRFTKLETKIAAQHKTPIGLWANNPSLNIYPSPTLVVGNIPRGNCIDDIVDDITARASEMRGKWPNEFNFEFIDGDWYPAYPGVNTDGKFELFTADGYGTCWQHHIREHETENAYRLARCARFEHGETPRAARGDT